jgi:hypothetical protein
VPPTWEWIRAITARVSTPLGSSSTKTEVDSERNSSVRKSVRNVRFLQLGADSVLTPVREDVPIEGAPNVLYIVLRMPRS